MHVYIRLNPRLAFHRETRSVAQTIDRRLDMSSVDINFRERLQRLMKAFEVQNPRRMEREYTYLSICIQ